MNYQEFKKHLYKYQDLKYREGALVISNSPYDMIGVRAPDLRRLINEHYLDEDLLLEEFEIDDLQELAVAFFTIGLKRCKSFKEQLEFLDKYIYKAKGWAVTDSLNRSIKKPTFDEFYPFFAAFSKSEHTFKRRMGYILGMKFANDKRIIKTFKYFSFYEEYMVMMAEAWLLCEIAIYHQNEVYEFLSSINDIVLIRKTICKICDSFRFDDESKNRFKNLRLNLKNK